MGLLRLTLLLSVIISICSATSSKPYIGEITQQNRATEELKKYRLPEQAIDITNYNLEIKPYFEGERAFTFDGRVIITAELRQPNQNKIILHAKSLIVHAISINKYNVLNPSRPIIVQIKNTETDEIHDFLIINLVNNLSINDKIEIDIKYTGFLTDDIYGFHRSYYYSVENDVKKRKWIGITQFQPVHARRAFPCFDEPKYKATFDITIWSPSGYSALSNMKKIEPPNPVIDGFVKEQFETTPEISAYLIAFVISNFESIGNDDFKIYARPEAVDQGHYALNKLQLIIERLGEYLDLPFDTTMKNKYVAIPDFSTKAMRNHELATYREAYLLYKDEETSVRYKQQIVEILANEIAHYWFGNLLTCEWWSDIWLNEGFATYFQYFMIDTILKNEDEKMDMMTQFNVAQIHTIMLNDATNGALSLKNENIYTPSQIQAQFGSHSYSKGASIIRMIRDWIGEDKFQKGLQKYIEDNKYKTVTEDNLVDALQDDLDNTKYNVKEVVSSWIKQKGFPLLKVEKKSNGNITINQTKFMKDNKPPGNVKWHIPITYATRKREFENTKAEIVMSEKTIELNVKHDWFVLNVQQTGYYRVNYSPEMWNDIVKVLKDDKQREDIHTLNRAQIVDDLFNLAREGYIDYSLALERTEFLENEIDYAPWTAAYASFKFLREQYITKPQIQAKIDNYLLTLMKNLLKLIDVTEKYTDEHLTKLFRMNTLNIACQIGYEKCKTDSIALFKKWKNEKTKVPVNLREYVYCNALRHGDTDDFDFLWNKYLNDDVMNDKVVIMNALGCTNDTTRIQMLLYQTLLQNSPIRNHDRMSLFNSLLNGNPSNINAVYSFVKLYLLNIKEVYGASNLYSMLESMATRMSENQLKDFAKLVDDHNLQMDVKDIEAIEAAIKKANDIKTWLENKTDNIEKWLNKGLPKDSANSISISITLMFVMQLILVLNK